MVLADLWLQYKYGKSYINQDVIHHTYIYIYIYTDADLYLFIYIHIHMHYSFSPSFSLYISTKRLSGSNCEDSRLGRSGVLDVENREATGHGEVMSI